MKKTLCLLGWVALLLVLSVRTDTVEAQALPPDYDETFAVTSVNPLLLIGADAVVRLEHLHFEVDNPSHATLNVRRAMTVMNPQGRERSELYIAYDKLRELKKLKGQLRNAQGTVIRKLKKEDQEDLSAIAGYSLYEDNRVRLARLYHDAYPYTVEYEYEVDYNGLINWPTWYPQEVGMSVEFGQYDIVVPKDMSVRYQVEGAALEPGTREDGRRKEITWQVQQLPALKLEPNGPSGTEQAIRVHMAPATFEIEGARGNMASWESFGQWYYNLSEGRDELPEEAVAEVQRRIAGATDDREKVRRLYEYLQEKTRYVSVQLGLGGWQPFDAEYVHTHGYGDCKALTNYMLALLKEADIPSFPALIRAGGRAAEVLTDFPSNQFNHVILYVPLPGDPVWLECTSQTVPFGHLGSFTEDRDALVVMPEGGKIMHTPESTAQQNQQIRQARVRLDVAGNGVATVETRYTGNQQDRVRQALAQQSGREREAWLHDLIDIPSFQVLRADFSTVDQKQMAIDLPVELELKNYASRTGTRLFVPLTFMERWSYVPPSVEERTQPVHLFTYAFADTDTIRYELPAGYRVEAMPDPVTIETAFGRYAAQVEATPEGSLTYHRIFEITEPKLPAEQYDAFRDFLSQVSQADRAMVVLVEE